MSPTSTQSTKEPPMSHTLINFNIPNYLKHDFDELAKFKRVSRTSILNRLIELYCRNEFRELEETSRFNQLLLSVKARNQPSAELVKPLKLAKQELDHNSVLEPPMIPYITDDYEWEARFKL